MQWENVTKLFTSAYSGKMKKKKSFFFFFFTVVTQKQKTSFMYYAEQINIPNNWKIIYVLFVHWMKNYLCIICSLWGTVVQWKSIGLEIEG